MNSIHNMRILLSNDDGIEAEGLKCLERIARTLSDDVWIVAPESDQSGASHALSLSKPIRCRSLGSKKFAVRGTPTDSVLMGVLDLVPPPAPDLVLSGINRGGNLGDDVTYSGTVAAAMEGVLHGIPSIALSQYTIHRDHTQWATAEHFAPDLIQRLLFAGWPSDVLININFPDVSEEQLAGVSVTYQGRGKSGSVLDRRVDPRGQFYYWINSERGPEVDAAGSDLSAVRGGKISVTPLSVNLTDRDSHNALTEALS